MNPGTLTPTTFPMNPKPTTTRFESEDDEIETMLERTEPGLFDRSASDEAFRRRLSVIRRFNESIPPDARGAFLVNVPRTKTESPVLRPISTNMTVGRGPQALWRVADEPRLSSLHFSITRIGDKHTVTDLNSKNGTRLNENPHPVKVSSLRHGDFIHAGGLTFMFVENCES